MPSRAHPDRHDPAGWWLARAKRTAGLVNFAWTLDKLATPLLVASVGLAASILAARIRGLEIGMWHLNAAWPALGCAFAIAWIRARGNYETRAQALVRIETALGLHNALSAAREGAAPWPIPSSGRWDRACGLRWGWRQLTIAPMLSISTVLAAMWLPVQSGSVAANAPPGQPMAWSQLDQELDALMEAAVIEETSLDRTRKRLDQLRSRDPDEWFSHASMEATDALLEAHRGEIARFGEALARGADAVEGMRDTAAEARIREFEDYRSALRDLADGEMKPNATLREQLEGLTKQIPGELTPEQLERLRDQLHDACDALRNAQGPADPDAEHLAEGRPIPGNGDPEGDEGHDPGVLGAPTALEMADGEITPLAARDLSRAALGDLLETRDRPHEPNETNPQPPHDGGTAAATGRGGDRIWRDSLDPAEQRTLRNYFN